MECPLLLVLYLAGGEGPRDLAMPTQATIPQAIMIQPHTSYVKPLFFFFYSSSYRPAKPKDQPTKV